jgi:hypothetical protein
VPAGLAAGTYDLTVTNPDGGSDTLANAFTVINAFVEYDDLHAQSNNLWVDPLDVRAGEEVNLGLVVHRQGGNTPLSNIIVRFYEGNPDNGGTLIGDGIIYFIAADSSESTTMVPWILASAGDYTIYAHIDPDNDISETIETNNTISRTIAVLPPTMDTEPPTIDSFTIGYGVEMTDVPTVTLEVSAEDNVGGSGMGSIFFVEFEYVQGAGRWVPVQASGWLTYTNSYTWTLVPVAGVRYMQAWAADRAGNISTSPYVDSINYLPPDGDQIGAGQVRFYRLHVEAGQNLNVTVTPISGDPDLYIWSPDGRLAGMSNESIGEDQVSIYVDGETNVAGTYQIEVHGYTAANYTISISLGGAGIGTEGSVAGLINASKTPPDAPIISVDDRPPGQTAIPEAPIIGDISRIYLPIILRNASSQ